MTNTIMELVLSFVEIAKELRPKYIEAWLNGEVNDYDMDITLIDEKKHRSKTYKRIMELKRYT